jgi:hypothetical protein
MSIRSRDSLGEIDTCPYVRCGAACESGSLAYITVSRFDQFVRRGPLTSYERIAKRDQVHKVFAGGGYLQEDASGVRNEQSSVTAGILVASGAMGNDAPPLRSRRSLRNADVDLIELADEGAPEGSGGLVTRARAGRTDVQRSGRHLVDSNLRPGPDVQTVEQPLKASAAQVDIGESPGKCLGTSKWL